MEIQQAQFKEEKQKLMEEFNKQGTEKLNLKLEEMKKKE